MSEQKKMNCWEFKKCGREPGGSKVAELGVCPVATEQGANGIHNGINGGRCCWVVTGSLCKGEIQGSYAQKFGQCHKCDFYDIVRKEELPYFKVGIVVLNIIKKKRGE
jgi:hypothetical protein